MIGTDDYTTIEGDAYGAGSSLDDVRFGIHVIDRTESSLKDNSNPAPYQSDGGLWSQPC